MKKKYPLELLKVVFFFLQMTWTENVFCFSFFRHIWTGS